MHGILRQAPETRKNPRIFAGFAVRGDEIAGSVQPFPAELVR